MKLINNSEQFVLQYGGTDYTIPNGEFEVTDDKLGYHILFIANKWGKDIKDIPNSSTPQITQIKKEEIKIKKIEEKVEEPKIPKEVKESKSKL